MAKFDVSKHVLVPKHTKVSDRELKDLFEKHSLEVDNLPRIHRNDPAILHLEVKEDDVVKIVRESPTAGRITFYRRVVSE